MKNPQDSIYSTISDPAMLEPIERQQSIYSLQTPPQIPDLTESVVLKLESIYDLETTNVTRYSELFVDELGR